MLLKPKRSFWQKLQPRTRLDWFVIIAFAAAMALNVIQYVALDYVIRGCVRAVMVFH